MDSCLSNEYTIFWGDAITCPVSIKKPEFQGWMEQFVAQNKLRQLVYLKQEHLATGLIIDQPLQAMAPKTIAPALEGDVYEGDYLITNQPNIGIGVVTADCLPIVYHDPVRKVVAVAHAGWKGTVAGIATNVVQALQKRFGTDPAHLQITFGPHARTCCYEVQPDFLVHIPEHLLPHVFVKRGDTIYFSSAIYNRLELVRAGVKVVSIDDPFPCTICDEQYHSRRRCGAEYVGQSTIVWLK